MYIKDNEINDLGMETCNHPDWVDDRDLQDEDWVEDRWG